MPIAFKKITCGLGGLGIAAILNNYHPFILSYPQVKKEWVIVLWENNIFTAVIGYLIAIIFYSFLSKKKGTVDMIRWAIIFTLFHTVFIILLVGVQTAFLWQQSPLGRNFLPPRSGYYFTVMQRFVNPYVLALVMAIAASMILWLLKIGSGGRLIGKIEIWFAFWMILTLGWERSFTALLLSLALAVLWYGLKREKYIRLAPFLMVSMFIAMFFGKEGTRIIFGLN